MGQAKSIDRIYSLQRLICPRFPPECCLGRYLLRDFARGLQSRFMLCYILESRGLFNTGYGLLVTGYGMFLEVSTYVRMTDVERFGILHKNLRLLFCVVSFCYRCYRSKYICSSRFFLFIRPNYERREIEDDRNDRHPCPKRGRQMGACCDIIRQLRLAAVMGLSCPAWDCTLLMSAVPIAS